MGSIVPVYGIKLKIGPRRHLGQCRSLQCPYLFCTSQCLHEDPVWIDGETCITGLASAMSCRSGVIMFHTGVSNACGSHHLQRQVRAIKSVS